MRGLVFLGSLCLIISGMLFCTGANVPASIEVPVSYAVIETETPAATIPTMPLPITQVAIGGCANGQCPIRLPMTQRKDLQMIQQSAGCSSCSASATEGERQIRPGARIAKTVNKIRPIRRLLGRR